MGLLDGWFDDEREQVWMSHGDHVSAIAPGFEVFGTSPNAPFAVTQTRHAISMRSSFIPEVHHTPNGAKLYENFIVEPDFPAIGPWALSRQALQAIREQVGDQKVICGLSGGVTARCRRFDPRGDWRPADLRFRRPRLAARR